MDISSKVAGLRSSSATFRKEAEIMRASSERLIRLAEELEGNAAQLEQGVTEAQGIIDRAAKLRLQGVEAQK